MREIREILAKLDDHTEPAVLATVVDLKGSSYRLPGARMLVLPDGGFVGTVSGGCIEADVLERAARVAESGIPEVFLYDTTSDEDSVFSMNMGCRGVVRILLEKAARDSDYISFLARSINERKTGFVATLVPAASRDEGVSRFYFDVSGQGGEGAPGQVADEVKRIASDRRGRRPAGLIELEDGTEYFIEIVEPPKHLVVFGAGADAIPLVHLANRIGWETTVFDHRPAYADAERFPSADTIVVARPEDAADRVTLGRDCAAIVMSHNYGHDKEYLRRLLSAGLTYVGALGPKFRTERILEELRDEGESFAESELAVLRAPVGLDIGGADPETIAVSMIAEIQAVFANREGGALKDRNGSIYEH